MLANRVIWKYVIPVDDTTVIHPPPGAQFLPHVEASVANGHEVLWLWVLSVPSVEEDTVTVEVVGTGNWMPDVEGMNYVGTTRTAMGMVWHVWVDAPVVSAIPAEDIVRRPQ